MIEAEEKSDEVKNSDSKENLEQVSLSENIFSSEKNESDEIVETPLFTEMASLWNQILGLNSDNIKYERIYGEYTKRIDYWGTFTYYWNKLSYSAHEDGDQVDPYLTFNGNLISLSKFNEEVKKLRDLVSKEPKKKKSRVDLDEEYF